MDTYNNQLTREERSAVEWALDELQNRLNDLGTDIVLANDDRAGHAAEALARYIVASRA